MKRSNRCVIGRERNVVRVDFGRQPDPPAPKFPGAAALRSAQYPQLLNASAWAVRKEEQLTGTNSWATSS